jgi:hypothetical protein
MVNAYGRRIENYGHAIRRFFAIDIIMALYQLCNNNNNNGRSID